MSEIETLRAQVAELTALLDAAKREHQAVLRGVAIADAELTTLRRYTQPATSREAISNLAVIADFDAPTDERIWRHITPTYKVAECIDLALQALRGGR